MKITNNTGTVILRHGVECLAPDPDQILRFWIWLDLDQIHKTTGCGSGASLVSCVGVIEFPDDEMSQGKLLMYNRAELKTSDHRSATHVLSFLFHFIPVCIEHFSPTFCQ